MSIYTNSHVFSFLFLFFFSSFFICQMRIEEQPAENAYASDEDSPMLLNEQTNEETHRETTVIRGPNATIQTIFLTLCLAG